ncbi:hypothetical protein B0T14DRAFT_601202 [Immersiella caudata]|uniref:Uncharacterized protein n=1 Tax=Immersiella caudata TaxID=314043 RepID=A0AA39WVK4_9PEZI|nr:hypothetical protein B0T14DRAFT_601202 [Immersiella caudata]
MIFHNSLLASLGLLLVQGTWALPQARVDAFPVDHDLTGILEKVRVHTPIVWHEATNEDGSKGNFTDIDNAAWDAAIATLALHQARTLPQHVAKRQIADCFSVGTWAHQVVVKDGIVEACGLIAVTAVGFTRVHQRVGFNTAGDPMTVHYLHRCNVQEGPLTSIGNCLSALSRILEHCTGDNSETRGGRITWTTSNQYSIAIDA